MQKTHVYILIILAIWLVAGFLSIQWQINKMDRKLNCIYSSVVALPAFVVPEMRTSSTAVLEQIEFVEEACSTEYIFDQ